MKGVERVLRERKKGIKIKRRKGWRMKLSITVKVRKGKEWRGKSKR